MIRFQYFGDVEGDLGVNRRNLRREAQGHTMIRILGYFTLGVLLWLVVTVVIVGVVTLPLVSVSLTSRAGSEASSVPKPVSPALAPYSSTGVVVYPINPVSQ